jgi:hypothetical protein
MAIADNTHKCHTCQNRGIRAWRRPTTRKLTQQGPYRVSLLAIPKAMSFTREQTMAWPSVLAFVLVTLALF